MEKILYLVEANNAPEDNNGYYVPVAIFPDEAEAKKAAERFGWSGRITEVKMFDTAAAWLQSKKK